MLHRRKRTYSTIAAVCGKFRQSCSALGGIGGFTALPLLIGSDLSPRQIKSRGGAKERDEKAAPHTSGPPNGVAVGRNRRLVGVGRDMHDVALGGVSEGQCNLALQPSRVCGFNRNLRRQVVEDAGALVRAAGIVDVKDGWPYVHVQWTIAESEDGRP